MNKKMKVTERDNDDETDEIFTSLGCHYGYWC